LIGDFYEDLIWHDLIQIKPSKEEIDNAINNLDQLQKNAENEKAIKKAALLNKLGITEDEAKLLLS